MVGDMPKEETIPKKIRKLLTEDETVKKSFDLHNCEVYATDKRLFRVEGRSIRDFDYTHVSSVEYISKRHWGWVAFGIVLLIVGAVVGSFTSGEVKTALVIIGLIIMFIGAISKSERVEANVVGVSQPVKFSGSRQDLDSLLRIIREKRTATASISKTERSPSADVADTIRKLAELRDEGILTQEEFEEKKTRLLQNSK